MATVSSEQIVAEQSIFPFTGLTAIQRQQSGIARAQVSLVWPQTTLSATSSGEIKAVRLEGGLPRNFAYVYAGGSIKIGRTATTDVLDQNRGVFFENEIQCAITGTSFSDSWKMLNEGAVKVENNANKITGAFEALATSSATATKHFTSPGILNGFQGLYQKIYKDATYPRIIYRGENSDVTVTADVIDMIDDPFPSAQYVVLGEMHFLQYDIDQAYNYLIHSPIPVR